MSSVGDEIEVSFIIVTYQRPDFLQQCLDSVFAQQGLHHPVEVIVVDNGGDAVVHKPADIAIELRVETPGSNLGVAGGRNLGMRLARGKYLVMLDDDAVWCTRDAVVHMIEHFDRDAQCGAIAIKSLLPSGQVIRLELPHPNKDYLLAATQPVLVPYFYGVGHSIRAEAFAKAGSYPDRFFYGMEEVDFSLRLYDAGYHILFDPAICVHHYQSQDGRLVKESRYWTQNALNKTRVAGRLLPLPYTVTTLVVWSTAALVKTRDPILVFRELWKSLWNERRVLAKERKPIQPSTVGYLKRIGARLWY